MQLSFLCRPTKCLSSNYYASSKKAGSTEKIEKAPKWAYLTRNKYVRKTKINERLGRIVPAKIQKMCKVGTFQVAAMQQSTCFTVKTSLTHKYDEKTIGVKVNYIACQEELSKFQENKQGIKTTLWGAVTSLFSLGNKLSSQQIDHEDATESRGNRISN